MLAALRPPRRLPRRLPRAPRSAAPRAVSTTTPSSTSSTSTTSSSSSSSTATPRIIQYLGYGGALPFVAGGLISSAAPDGTSPAQATRVYGAAILSFLGGVHWGLSLPRAPVVALDFVYSVTPSLVACAAALAPLPQGLALLSAGFAGAWAWDEARLRAHPRVPPWYRALRRPLTLAAAGGCLLACRAVRTVRDGPRAHAEEGEDELRDQRDAEGAQ